MSNDSINILKYLIPIELSLLAVATSLGGLTALIWVSIITYIMVSAGYIFVLSMGSHAPSSRVINKSLIKVLLIFAYLSLGVGSFLFPDKVVTVFSYVWLVSIVAVILWLIITSYEHDPERIDRQACFEQQRLFELREREKADYDLVISNLGEQYELTMSDEKHIKQFFKLSKSASKQYKTKKRFANHITNLFHNVILEIMKGLKDVKGLEHDAKIFSLKVYKYYITNILPEVGLADRTADIVSYAVVLSMELNDDGLFNNDIQRVFDEYPEMLSLEPRLLFFNLACRYALKQDKEKLLYYVEKAMSEGVLAMSFIDDSDFSFYMEDEDFLAIIHAGDNQ